MPKKSKPNLLLLGAGNMLASMAIAGFLLGYLVDYLANTTPIFLLSFGLLGAIGGILKVKDMMVKEAKKSQQKLKK